MINPKKILPIIAFGMLIGLAFFFYRTFRTSSARSPMVWKFLSDPAKNQNLVIKAGTRCGSSPFIFPTTGMAGYLWDDSFKVGKRHQGVDIFAGTDIGQTEVIAAYAGFLTRLPDWKSSVIVRIPTDPLLPGRQIWVYYTHMADAEGNSYISENFPPGTSEKPVDQGAFLGFQGDYSGDPNNPVGVHLHISVVIDDGTGHFKNELEIGNTLDPSPYLGLDLNAQKNPDRIPVCK
ncbi:MAG: hypothetical protein WCP19_05175 [Chloroflexota bacterium]